MMRRIGFGAALFSLALASGCAKGGNGVVPPAVTVDVAITSPNNVSSTAIYPTQSLTLTATVQNSTTTAVTWSLSGPGTLTPVTPATTPATATYVAPGATGSATITATLVSNPSVTGPLALSVIDITTEVTPATLSVGNGLIQQFTAVAVPDDAPQTFNWTCTAANGAPCANFVQDPNVSGLAYYKAQDSCGSNCVQIAATSTIDSSGCVTTPTNCTTAKVSLVSSRVSGTYAFQFSGYDTSNNATSVVGTFTAASNGSITSGVEDELTSTGWAQHPITGSYVPISASDPNSNNAGTLTLTTGTFPNKFQAVINSAGTIQMIESDGHGTGSGTAQVSAASSFFKGTQTYAFGFTGADSSGKRVGYVGVLPMTGNGTSGTITGGQIDVNENGNSSNGICGAAPCAVAGSYLSNGNGSWHLALSSPVTMNFDFFISSGSANKATPLTFYAISTDPSANPAVSGTMVLQDSTQTYNNADFNGNSVSALTGVNGANANVALIVGTTDGNGAFSGQFDQNNAGSILSDIAFPAAGSNNYTYAASGANGRYTFQMLGDPTASPAVAPLPFVLYASGQNRGFLLDQSSASVMTGTMSPQGQGSGNLAASELPGTFAAATTSSATAAVDPIAANLLLTFVNAGTCTAECVNGTIYDSATPSGVIATGANPSYAIQVTGNGTIALTAPSAQNFVIYAVDTSGCANQGVVCTIQDFLMMDVDKTNLNPSIIFAQQ